MRVISASEAIREATNQLLQSSPDYFIIGEGVPDPKACFGTTTNLMADFPDRVFDMPIIENGGTGICIGASLLGMRPIMVHMRDDFLMYAMDQIVNNAAKWYSMFGGQRSVPMVIRAILGRGWGQGQQHSQNLEAMFAHVPGLKVVVPSNAHNAKGLLIAAAKDNNPVIYLEHRWVHSVTSEVPEEMYECEIGKARIARAGDDLTIVTWGYMTLECLKAAEFLSEQGVSVEVIDLMSLRPIDYGAIRMSVAKTKCLLVVSEAWAFGGVAGEIIAQIAESGLYLKHRPRRLCNPNYPPASSPGLTKNYYPGPWNIFVEAANIIDGSLDSDPVHSYQSSRPHDVPNPDFKGPF